MRVRNLMRVYKEQLKTKTGSRRNQNVFIVRTDKFNTEVLINTISNFTKKLDLVEGKYFTKA